MTNITSAGRCGHVTRDTCAAAVVDLVPGAVLDGVSVTGRVLVHSSGHGVVLQVSCDWWRAHHVTQGPL